MCDCEVALAGNSHDQLPTGPGRAVINMVAACRRFCVTGASPTLDSHHVLK